VNELAYDLCEIYKGFTYFSGGFFPILPLIGVTGFLGVSSSSDSETDNIILTRLNPQVSILMSLMQFLMQCQMVWWQTHPSTQTGEIK